MRKLVFATHNLHKLSEVRRLLEGRFEVVGLSEIGCDEDIPETASTLEGNAAIKAQYVFDKYHLDCFADDTGLEVKALNGAPGVYSARYAGPQNSSLDNISKLLSEMNGLGDRSARFRTSVCLIISGETYYFNGTVRGNIATETIGDEGFGYDPVFVPEGKDVSFAQMTSDQKNAISHRGRAIRALIDFLMTC